MIICRLRMRILYFSTCWNEFDSWAFRMKCPRNALVNSSVFQLGVQQIEWQKNDCDHKLTAGTATFCIYIINIWMFVMQAVYFEQININASIFGQFMCVFLHFSLIDDIWYSLCVSKIFEAMNIFLRIWLNFARCENDLV